jgi:NAD(P)H-flavin reductase
MPIDPTIPPETAGHGGLGYRATLLDRTRLGADIWRLRFSRPEATAEGLADWQARSGQYVTLGLTPDLAPRPYSIASAAAQPYLDLHIRDTGHGLSQAAAALAPGEAAWFGQPEGRGLPASAHDRPLVFLAGGVGIAPVAALLEEGGFPVPPRLYWGVNTADSLYLHAHFAGLAAAGQLHYAPVVAEEAPGPWRHGSPLSALAVDVADLGGCAVYLSGPDAMVAAALPFLLRHGVQKAYIFGDGIGL